MRIDRRIMGELGLTPEQFQEMLEQIQRLVKEMEGELSELDQGACCNNNRGDLERLLREAMQQEMEQRHAGQFPPHAVHAHGGPFAVSITCKARSSASKACCRCSARTAKICKT